MTIGTITFQTDHDANITGTSLKHRNVKATYWQLVDLLGEPLEINADHSRVEWRVVFSDDEILCVYDWNDDRPIDQVDEWNIAGRASMVAGRIFDILKGRPIFV